MQTAVMDNLQQQMMANIEKVSPEALMQSWFTFDPKIAERLPGHVRDHGGPRRRAPQRQDQRQEIAMASTEANRRLRDRLRPPGLGLLLAEARGIFEFNASLLLSPLLMRAPSGDGHPVLALPGFLASDLSMAPMRRYLSELGYDAHAWRMGRNTGGISRMRAALRDRLAEIHSSSGRKVSLVGWSLGGVYARYLALQAPEMVRYVMTLGSPFANDVRATNATRLYEALSGEGVEDNSDLRQGHRRRSAGPDQFDLFAHRRYRELADLPPCARLMRAENIEVHLASHVGLGVNPAALWAVADRLAQGGGPIPAI